MALKSREQCCGTLPDLQAVLFQRSSSLNGNEPLQGPMKRERGGRVNSIIVDASWVSAGPPPPPRLPPAHPPPPFSS
eukprot:2287384-Pyramimonas_sp.AAC.1